MKCIIFLLKLPFRILALPIVILLFGVEGVLNAAEHIGGLIIGLYNFLLVAILIFIVTDKMWNQLWGFGLMVGLEGIVLAVVGIAHASISIIRDKLISFMMGQPYGAFV